MKLIKLTFLLTVLTATVCYGQNWQADKTYTDDEKWTAFTVGNLPIVISVPHGGTTVVDDAIRDCKGATLVTDAKTIETAREIEKAFVKKYKARPYIIISNLSRKNVDQNREIKEATCGNVAMEKPWHQFHNYIDTAISLATQKFGKVIYIDLHGHGHKNQRLELGYSLSAEELRDLKENDANLNLLGKKSSLTNLLTDDQSKNLYELLVGKNAFGTLISNEGVKAVPSEDDVAPLAGELYFNGGYNTRRYTSAKHPNVYGWQIECNFKGIRDEDGRPDFAKSFVNAMTNFFEKNLSQKLN